jgi:fatty acid-binding protein DegV
MVDGKLKMVKKERTNGACLNFFLEHVDTYANKYQKIYVDVIHLGMPKWADKLVEAIEEKYPNAQIHVTDHVSPVFYVHLGDKGFGISIIGLDE